MAEVISKREFDRRRSNPRPRAEKIDSEVDHILLGFEHAGSDWAVVCRPGELDVDGQIELEPLDDFTGKTYHAALELVHRRADSLGIWYIVVSDEQRVAS